MLKREGIKRPPRGAGSESGVHRELLGFPLPRVGRWRCGVSRGQTAMDRRQAGSGGQTGSADAHRFELVSIPGIARGGQRGSCRHRRKAARAAGGDRRGQDHAGAVRQGLRRRAQELLRQSGSGLRQHAGIAQPAGRGVRCEVRRRFTRLWNAAGDVGRSAADGTQPAAAEAGKGAGRSGRCAGGGDRRSGRGAGGGGSAGRGDGGAGRSGSSRRRPLRRTGGSRRRGGADRGIGEISAARKTRTVRRPTCCCADCGGANCARRARPSTRRCWRRRRPKSGKG